MDSAMFDDLLSSKKQISSNQFFEESLLKNIPQIMYMKNLNGAYIAGTSYGKKFLLTGVDEINNVNFCFDKWKKNFQEDDAKVISTKEALVFEYEIPDNNGRMHAYSVHKSPITGVNDKVIGVAVMIKNLDKEKLLNLQKDSFIATLGHDLKNPTIAQIRAVELLLKGAFGETSEKQREILQMLLDSCKYMNGMLSSMLATFRSEGGGVKLNFELFSFVDLVRECVDEMVYIAKNKDVNILINEICDNPMMCADKIQIKRVVMNLLSNGIKYAFSKSDLSICIYNEEGRTCFKFQNYSPYISPEKQKAIFARYVSFAEAHKELGIGLGLYASKRIVDAHNGEIYVKSSKDEKNEFGFKIPYNVSKTQKECYVAF